MAYLTLTSRLKQPFLDVLAQKKSIRGFDGLRGVCVLLVLAAHAGLTEDFDTGTVAVWVFFALSGFLIVPILQKARQRIEVGRSDIWTEVSQFLRDRALRIFPVYYAFLIFLLGVSLVAGSNRSFDQFQDAFLWMVSYGSNIYIAYIHGDWIGQFSHFWSLAIEQQFYMIFPLLFIVLPAERWPAAILGTSLLCLLMSSIVTGMDNFHFTVNTLSGFYAILLGGYFGIVLKSKSSHVAFSLAAVLPPLALLVLIWVQHLVFVAIEMRQASLIITPWLSCLLLLSIFKQQESASVAFFEMPWLRGLGVVSYGFYLFHNFVPGPVRSILERVTGQGDGMALEAAIVLLSTVITFVISVYSYVWFEKKFLVLKKKRAPTLAS